MKIAHISMTTLPASVGGKEVVVHNVANHQAKRGFDVSIITNWKQWKQSKNIYSDYKVFPVRVKIDCHGTADHQPGPLWLSTLQYGFYQMLHRYDIWHIHTSFPAAYLAKTAARMFKTPYIITCHGDDIQLDPETAYGLRLNPDTNSKIKKILLDAKLITAVSDSVHQEYLDIGVNETCIRDIPNGADIENIINHNVDKKKIRKQYGISQNDFLILSVGRNEPRKGFDNIPLIVKKLLEKNIKFTWVVAGKDTEKLSAIAKGQGLEGCLFGIGKVFHQGNIANNKRYLLPNTALIDLYKSADLFISVSHTETFGLVSIEAMAAQTPVIAFDVPGCRDIIQHNKTGILIPENAIDEMVNQIIRVKNQPVWASQLVKNAQAQLNRFQWGKIAEDYIQAYKSAIHAYI